MKKYYLLFLLVSLTSVYAQADKELANIANGEMKSAFKKMNLLLNPDTYNYDVTYHKIEVNVDPAVFYISGKVTTTYTALTDMNTLVFDLSKITDEGDEHFGDQIEVSAVRINNADLAFTRTDTALIITLPATQAAGTAATVEITYAGAPAGSGFGSFIASAHNGSPVMWTLSEPFGARDWWPCKQDLNDKVNSIDFYITAPTEYTSVSNGLEVAKVNNGNGTSTTHFHHGHPIPAYLIAFAVSNYQVYNQQGGLGTPELPYFPIINYLYPETAANNISSVAVTPDIINFYESKLVPYAFRDEKYGHCQFGWGGGMEHTTVSFLTAGNNGRYTRSLIAHEMGHQWFGDKVTCGSWKDIWLNEGWATYMASMVIQQFDGEDSFTTDKGAMINTITAANNSFPNGTVYLSDAEALNVNRIFDTRLTYDKGAMVLNMLRFKLGDDAFFQGVRDYLNDPLLAYGYAHTADFQAHLETASGISLSGFFDDWIYKRGYPIYTITATNATATQARITINQTQSADSNVSFFEMPVPVRLTGSGGQFQDYVLDNTTNGQQFLVNVPFTVTGVVVNVKKDIITKNGTAILATENFDILTGASLYPNPATNKLTLNIAPDAAVKQTIFYNTIGQKVKETATETIWDVSDLASGVYVVSVATNLGSKQIKFVKN